MERVLFTIFFYQDINYLQREKCKITLTSPTTPTSNCICICLNKFWTKLNLKSNFSILTSHFFQSIVDHTSILTSFHLKYSFFILILFNLNIIFNFYGYNFLPDLSYGHICNHYIFNGHIFATTIFVMPVFQWSYLWIQLPREVGTLFFFFP